MAVKANTRRCLGIKSMPVLPVDGKEWIPLHEMNLLLDTGGYFYKKTMQKAMPGMVFQKMRYEFPAGVFHKASDCAEKNQVIRFFTTVSRTVRKNPRIKRAHEWASKIPEQLDMFTDAIQPDQTTLVAVETETATPSALKSYMGLLVTMSMEDIAKIFLKMDSELVDLRVKVATMQPAISPDPLRSKIKAIVDKYARTVSESTGEDIGDIKHKIWTRLHIMFKEKTGIDAMLDAKDLDKTGIEVITRMNKLPELKACVDELLGFDL